MRAPLKRALACFSRMRIMTDLVSLLPASVVVASGLAALGAWYAIVVYSFMMVRQIRSGVPRWGRSLIYNPFNVVFRPDLLTDRGLAYRRRLGWAVAAFVCIVLGGFIVGSLTMKLAP